MSLGPAAFLGLGAIGAPMAARLAARGPLTVWNRTRARAEEFALAHRGVRIATTPREAAAGADVVVTCLPTSAEVEALLDGPDGLLAGLAAGALLLDCTSGDPAGSRRIAARVAERGVAFADAPVSGGTNGAASGTLTIMVGADEPTFERARPVLALMGSRIVHVGPIGAGDALLAYGSLALSVSGNIVAASILGCMAAAIACERPGNVPVSPADVDRKLRFVEKQALLE